MGDPRKYVDSQLTCLNQFGCDGVWGMAVNEVSEALGCQILVHPDDVPVERNGPLMEERDLSRLLEPDFDRSTWMTRKEEVIHQLRKKAGDAAVVIAPAITPVRAAVMTRGLQNFFSDFIEAPEFIKDLLDLCLRHCIGAGERLARAGADFLFFPLPEASRDMISKTHYEMFIHPCMTKIMDAMHRKGIKALIHTCGNWSDRFGRVAELRPHMVQLTASVDLRTVRNDLGQRMGLYGKVNSVETLLQGRPKAVRTESLQNIRDAKGMEGGFILGSDCAVPRDTPLENIQAMVEAAREAGKTFRP
jgi:uroporphyrinogen decarboxylase